MQSNYEGSEPNRDELPADLVFEELPNGEHTWLRPTCAGQLARYRLDYTRVVVADLVDADWSPETRIEITDKGRRDLAIAQAVDRGPTVAEVARLSLARCSACHQLQSTPSCDRREHWGV